MMIKDMVKGQRYKIKDCPNVFFLRQNFDLNKKCFVRQDGMFFYGREFIEYKEGKMYLNVEEVS